MTSTNKKYYRRFCVFIVCVTTLSISAACFGQAGQFELNNPYWFMLFDSAGYMDITYYYPSERHEYGYHEQMTGDWAAACWYQGIKQGSNQAQYLTDQFIAPYFSTGSPFAFGSFGVSNSSCNPVWTGPYQPTGYIPGSNYYSIGSTGNDTGWSDVNDGKLYVKIFYEVVDLGQQDANGVGGSPITFRDANGTLGYVYSDACAVVLITYSVKNISDGNVNQDI